MPRKTNISCRQRHDDEDDPGDLSYMTVTARMATTARLLILYHSATPLVRSKPFSYGWKRHKVSCFAGVEKGKPSDHR